MIRGRGGKVEIPPWNFRDHKDFNAEKYFKIGQNFRFRTKISKLQGSYMGQGDFKTYPKFDGVNADCVEN